MSTAKTKWLSNARLITLEAILLVGLSESLIEAYVMALSIPYWLQILFVMCFIAGAFGILMSVVSALAKSSITKGQKLLSSLPIATPQLLIHGAALAGIFWLYLIYY